MLELLETQSQYRDDVVEGVYVRIDNGDWSSERGKLVRSDFIQGIEEHWMKKELVKNIVKFE